VTPEVAFAAGAEERWANWQDVIFWRVAAPVLAEKLLRFTGKNVLLRFRVVHLLLDLDMSLAAAAFAETIVDWFRGKRTLLSPERCPAGLQCSLDLNPVVDVGLLLLVRHFVQIGTEEVLGELGVDWLFGGVCFELFHHRVWHEGHVALIVIVVPIRK
jgi:hypothetical protein